MAVYEFIVPVNPVPAPRYRKSDKWKPSSSVLMYREFRDAVIMFARNYGMPGQVKTPVALSFVIGLAGRRNKDLDNIIKGIKDALVAGGHLPDDTYKEVPAYRDPVEVVCLCDYCPKRLPKRKGGYHADCGAVAKCQRGFAYVKIVEGVELTETTRTLVEAAVGGHDLFTALKRMEGKDDGRKN